ncbi:hypothetical protein [Lacinutrix sp. Bg11-31]|uniref:hypothetical protein n=1 Tax=Lacinutrix sp. Bg11-31 TaxID=2057808 RepID=UPI000C314A4C|nr:hypothetical protein [Lacinutrix sp. Bg11-31]AUC82246.1 hypothetical protein CW733_08940 [Lacinutrix sp. Bg11-31]
MKKLLIVLSVIVLLGCSDKSVLLPEIENATITEITDVSPAYIFYDETKPDSLELNKGNLIISTHWLVNVDKRLTLKQVIPSIIELQEKKRNSSHKNESARNYYTCNDTSIKNLGFLDFTDVVYVYESKEFDLKNNISLAFIDTNRIQILALDSLDQETSMPNLASQLEEVLSKNENTKTLNLAFNQKLSFQDYITFKSKLSQLNLENTIINNEEYLFN